MYLYTLAFSSHSPGCGVSGRVVADFVDVVVERARSRGRSTRRVDNQRKFKLSGKAEACEKLKFTKT